MTDIEREARRRLNEVRAVWGLAEEYCYTGDDTRENNMEVDAVCRMLEELAAFQESVSEAVQIALAPKSALTPAEALSRFILPKPAPVDPLVEALNAAGHDVRPGHAEDIRKALAARGLTIAPIQPEPGFAKGGA